MSSHKLRTANEESDELLRAVHSATKDLRAAMREARQVIGELDTAVRAAIGAELEARCMAAIEPMLEDARNSLTQSMIDSRDLIEREFETLYRKLMQKDAPHHQQLSTIVDEIAASPHQGRLRKYDVTDEARRMLIARLGPRP